jgi:hypothetical protein
MRNPTIKRRDNRDTRFSKVTASIALILGTLGLSCQEQTPILTVDKANELVRESAEVHQFDQRILAKLGYAKCAHSVRALRQLLSQTSMYAHVESACEAGPKPLDGLDVKFKYEDGAWKLTDFSWGNH